MSDKPCGCQGGASSNNKTTSVEERAVVPFHAYPLAPSNAPWDAGKEMGSTKDPADWKKMSTLVLGDAKNKGSYKLPHHRGPSAKFATVRRGVANALARLNQVKGASAQDKSGGKRHLAKHMAEFHKKDGKDFDVEKFERDLALIEAMRDAAAENVRESITRRLVKWILGEDERLLVHAEFYGETKSADVFKIFEPIDPINPADKAFSNEKMNSKLKKASASVEKAMSEIDDPHSDVMESLDRVKDMIANVLTPEEQDSDDGVSDKLNEAYSTAEEVKRAVMRSRTLFNEHMKAVMEHLGAVCDYAAPDESGSDEDGEDNNDENENENDNDGDEQAKDDESTAEQKPNAAADGQTPKDGEDDEKSFGQILDEATKQIGAASNDLEQSKGSVPSQTERSAGSDNGEFDDLLDAVTQIL